MSVQSDAEDTAGAAWRGAQAEQLLTAIAWAGLIAAVVLAGYILAQAAGKDAD